MVKLQEELIISIGKKNKSGSINRFESLFLQFKKIKKPCQEKNDILQKKFFLGQYGETRKSRHSGENRSPEA
jgi:hypothetical protein